MKAFAQNELGGRARTVGEKLFEEYLYSQGITDFEYEKERDGKAAKIDYAVTLEREYLFEVKDFEYTGIWTMAITIHVNDCARRLEN